LIQEAALAAADLSVKLSKLAGRVIPADFIGFKVSQNPISSLAEKWVKPLLAP